MYIFVSKCTVKLDFITPQRIEDLLQFKCDASGCYAMPASLFFKMIPTWETKKRLHLFVKI